MDGKGIFPSIVISGGSGEPDVKFNDALSGLFFILFGLLLFFMTRNYPAMPGQDYGPSLFPRLIAVLMAAGGLVLVAKGARKWRAEPIVRMADWTRSPRHIGNFAAVLLSLVFYILLSDLLGFVVTGSIVLMFLLVWLRGRAYWRSSLLITVLTVVLMHQAFGQVLRVPLPWGIFESYAW